MAEHNDLGKWGEDEAVFYLEDKGYNLAVIVCELNLKIIDRETYAEVILHDGDVLEVVSFVGGG